MQGMTKYSPVTRRKYSVNKIVTIAAVVVVMTVDLRQEYYFCVESIK